MLVSHTDATAYAAWLSHKTDERYRLLTADEWIYAARGSDNRPYPWGYAFDSSLCHMRDSRPGRPVPAEVGTYPSDSSPYGLQDVAGNIAEWTDSVRTDDLHVVAGAAFNSLPVMCQLDHNMSAPATSNLVHIGFRTLLEVQKND